MNHQPHFYPLIHLNKNQTENFIKRYISDWNKYYAKLKKKNSIKNFRLTLRNQQISNINIDTLILIIQLYWDAMLIFSVSFYDLFCALFCFEASECVLLLAQICGRTWPNNQWLICFWFYIIMYTSLVLNLVESVNWNVGCYFTEFIGLFCLFCIFNVLQKSQF